MNQIVEVFGQDFLLRSARTGSYNLLRRTVASSADWNSGGLPNTPAAVRLLETAMSSMSNAQLAFLICHTGYIPEEYAHDSSQETLYSKLVETVVREWAVRIGFNKSAMPTQKSSKEDITIRDEARVIVCDAKSFRLGRSQKAPNVKDALKEGDIKKWLDEYKSTSLIRLGGLIAFPSPHDWSGGSDFYQYLTNSALPIVCLFYEHMAFMLLNGIGSNALCGLMSGYAGVFPRQLTKADGNRDQYWKAVEGYLLWEHAVAWRSFNNAAALVIREMVHHTIEGVEAELTRRRDEIRAEIDEDATVDELRELLVDARFELRSFTIERQLSCIRNFRPHLSAYLSL